jgi:hypothetical protein
LDAEFTHYVAVVFAGQHHPEVPQADDTAAVETPLLLQKNCCVAFE